MTGLLDTHTILWAGFSPELLSRRVADILADERNELFVSAASAWEIATKVRLGKLPDGAPLEASFFERAAAARYQLRSITVADGLRAGRLVGNHGDPFDRMIAAQALADDIPVISGDARLDLFGVRRIW